MHQFCPKMHEKKKNIAKCLTKIYVKEKLGFRTMGSNVYRPIRNLSNHKKIQTAYISARILKFYLPKMLEK